MYLSKEEKKKRLTDLKMEMGSWMFALMSKSSRSEFIHLYKSMDTNPGLAVFKERFLNARELYRQMAEVCSDAQKPLLGKPFFYDISFSEYNDEGRTRISYNMNTFASTSADVSLKIPKRSMFTAFENAISDALIGETKINPDIQEKISVEGDIFADALQAESAYFSEVEKKRAEAAAR